MEKIRFAGLFYATPYHDNWKAAETDADSFICDKYAISSESDGDYG